jgi:hypothetical protein
MTKSTKTTGNGKKKKNAGTAKTPEVLPRAVDLSDEVLESVKSGQQSAIEAVRKFVASVDEALPEAVHPLRQNVVDSALELADQLVTTQYEFLRSVVRSAERALNKPRDSKD